MFSKAAQRFALAASGRDAEQARKRNPAEALKTARKRADSHLSAARCVGLLFEVKVTPIADLEFLVQINTRCKDYEIYIF